MLNLNLNYDATNGDLHRTGLESSRGSRRSNVRVSSEQRRWDLSNKVFVEGENQNSYFSIEGMFPDRAVVKLHGVRDGHEWGLSRYNDWRGRVVGGHVREGGILVDFGGDVVHYCAPEHLRVVHGRNGLIGGVFNPSEEEPNDFDFDGVEERKELDVGYWGSTQPFSISLISPNDGYMHGERVRP